ncbi:hypothetical protein D3C78_20760 [compost metagenome]
MNQEDLFETPTEELTVETIFKTYMASGDIKEDAVAGIISQAEDEVSQKRLIDSYLLTIAAKDRREVSKRLKTKIIEIMLLKNGSSKVFANNEGIWLRRYDKPMSIRLANFRIKERKILNTVSGDQSVTWVIIYRDPIDDTDREAEVSLNSGHLSRARDLQMRIGEKFIGARLGTQSDTLELLLEYVDDRQNVPVTNVISRPNYGFHIHHDIPYLLHARREETKFGEKIVDKLLLPDNESILGEIVYDGSAPAGLYSIPEHIEEGNWIDTLVTHYTQMTNPIKARTILGWAFSSIIKDRIAARITECHLPILFVYGNREVGKSVLVTSLARAVGWTGIQGNGEEIGLRGTSVAQIRDILGSYTNMPVVLGEFRLNNPNTEALTQFILGLYDGMSVTKKGRAKEQGKFESVSQSLDAPLIILGNDLIQDEAARSRLLIMHMEATDRQGQDTREHMEAVRNIPAGYVGHEIYTWILNNWDKVDTVIDEAYDLVEYLRPQVESRSFASIVCVAAGLKLIQPHNSIINDDAIKETAEWLAGSLKERRSDTMASKFVNFVADNHHWFRDDYANKIATKDLIAVGQSVWIRFRANLEKEGVSNVPDVQVIKDAVASEGRGIKLNQQIWHSGRNNKMVILNVQEMEKEYNIPVDTWKPDNEVGLDGLVEGSSE